ncbi:hypothetical protein HON22_01790 [Candidatus Peregrinibacteria bacterium]|jgi:hypothetical protein|nr:hypothetical protein [Candidatus Peregrinibacteria bacterium]
MRYISLINNYNTMEEKIVHIYPDKPAEEFTIPSEVQGAELDARDLKLLSMMRQVVREELQGVKGDVQGLKDETQGINEKLEKIQAQLEVGFTAMIDLHEVSKKRSQNQFVEILDRIH